uniref:RRM domain-containing protein n=1 Tax=Mycena chlorophos TaxID=658473 RepID=A0ABQ0L2K2_MYCCL|nr:predicted protein [Mycena chlorophos]
MALLERARHPLKQATQIQLTNIPKTATPSDIRRLVARAKAPGVESVAIEYKQLRPTGRAVLNLAHSGFLTECLRLLEGVSISGAHPVARPSEWKHKSNLMNGLSSELGTNGMHVYISGIPRHPRWEVPALEELLASHKFSRPIGSNAPWIEKLPLSRRLNVEPNVRDFRVRFGSVAEAHRFVRQVHMTYYLQSKHGTTYPLQAWVLY